MRFAAALALGICGVIVSYDQAMSAKVDARCDVYEDKLPLPKQFKLETHASLTDDTEINMYSSSECQCSVYFSHPEIEIDDNEVQMKKKLGQTQVQKITCSAAKKN